MHDQNVGVTGIAVLLDVSGSILNEDGELKDKGHDEPVFVCLVIFIAIDA